MQKLLLCFIFVFAFYILFLYFQHLILIREIHIYKVKEIEHVEGGSGGVEKCCLIAQPT